MKETYELENWCRGNEKDLGGNMVLFKQCPGGLARARGSGRRAWGGCGEADGSALEGVSQSSDMKYGFRMHAFL